MLNLLKTFWLSLNFELLISLNLVSADDGGNEVTYFSTEARLISYLLKQYDTQVTDESRVFLFLHVNVTRKCYIY